MTWAKEKGITKWTDAVIKELDTFLATHPKIKMISGIAVAGFMAYQYVNMMSMTGDVEFDFDVSSILGALTGSYSLIDLFGGTAGLKMLLLFVTNLHKASFPWPGNENGWLLFTAAVVYTVAKYKIPSLAHKMKPLLHKISKMKLAKEADVVSN
jgi:hypothetical protein